MFHQQPPPDYLAFFWASLQSVLENAMEGLLTLWLSADNWREYTWALSYKVHGSALARWLLRVNLHLTVVMMSSFVIIYCIVQGCFNSLQGKKIFHKTTHSYFSQAQVATRKGLKIQPGNTWTNDNPCPWILSPNLKLTKCYISLLIPIDLDSCSSDLELNWVWDHLMVICSSLQSPAARSLLVLRQHQHNH